MNCDRTSKYLKISREIISQIESGALQPGHKIYSENELINDLKPLKYALNITTLVLFLISGISIMSIVFFSTKERITEIGIRKTFGASRFDIFLQYISENFILSLIASLLAIAVSVIIVYITKNYLSETLYINFKTFLSLILFLKLLLAGILQGAMFSLFPCLYATKISVTDALRFE